MPQVPITKGVHHVGLTVPDLDATLSFFVNILKFDEVGEVASYPAAFVSDGRVMVTLWQARNLSRLVPFDRANVVGLHHLALAVEDPDSLRDLHATLLAHDDVEVEFAPERLGAGPTEHMMCFIPGGIRVEFIAAVA